MTTKKIRTQIVEGKMLMTFTQDTTIAVPIDTHVDVIDAHDRAFSHKKVSCDPSIGPVIEDEVVPYDFTDTTYLMSNGLSRSRLSSSRAISLKNGYSNSVKVQIDDKMAILSQHKAIKYAKDIIRKATDKKEDIEMTKDQIQFPPEIVSVNLLINSVDYTLTVGDIIGEGIPRGTARNVISRLIKWGIIKYTGEKRGKLMVYTGSVSRGEMIDKLSMMGRE